MDKLNLTRRKMLSAVGVTGAAIGGAGLITEPSVTYAETTQIEVGSATLEVDWRETYNGEVEEDTTDPNVVDSDGKNDRVIYLPNVLPGDVGTLSFRLRNVSSAQVDPELSLNLVGTAENGITEPERKAGDESPDTGELQTHIDASLWEDTGILGIDGFGADNATQDLGEPNIADGTLKDVAKSVDGYSLGPLSANGGQVSVAFRWEFADTADINIAQGDSVGFRFELGTANSGGP